MWSLKWPQSGLNERRRIRVAADVENYNFVKAPEHASLFTQHIAFAWKPQIMIISLLSSAYILYEIEFLPIHREQFDYSHSSLIVISKYSLNAFRLRRKSSHAIPESEACHSGRCVTMVLLSLLIDWISPSSHQEGFQESSLHQSASTLQRCTFFNHCG